MEWLKKVSEGLLGLFGGDSSKKNNTKKRNIGKRKTYGSSGTRPHKRTLSKGGRRTPQNKSRSSQSRSRSGTGKGAPRSRSSAAGAKKAPRPRSNSRRPAAASRSPQSSRSGQGSRRPASAQRGRPQGQGGRRPAAATRGGNTARRPQGARRPNRRPSNRPRTEWIKIGAVTHYFPNVNAGIIKVLKDQILVGEEIEFRGETTSFRQKVNSMEIDRSPIEMATPGCEIGIKVKARVREGDEVLKKVKV